MRLVGRQKVRDKGKEGVRCEGRAGMEAGRKKTRPKAVGLWIYDLEDLNAQQTCQLFGKVRKE